MPRPNSLLAASLLSALLFVPAASSQAQTATPAPDVKRDEAPAAPLIDVIGFRSAKFGMTEAEVRQAIVADFGVKPAAIRADDQPVDKTRVLSVKVPDIIPQGGTAELAYVLGYKSRKLIQVGLVWSKLGDETMKPETLMTNAQLLANYFQGRGYKPDSVITNTVVAEGIIVFRGRDAHDRTTLLLLRGQTSDVKGQHVFSPSSLTSLYIDDAQHPDVYRLPAGQF